MRLKPYVRHLLAANLLGLALHGAAAPPVAAQARSATPASVPLQVIASVFPSDFEKLAVLAGGGPYDAVLIAVRSRLPFQPKDGAPAAFREAYYGQVLLRKNMDPALEITLYGVPLHPSPSRTYGEGVEFQTASSQVAQVEPEGQQGFPPQWIIAGNEGVPKYSSVSRHRRYLYPPAFEFSAPELPVRLLDDERLGMFEYSLREAVQLRAKAPGDQRTGFVFESTPSHGLFLLGSPKLRWGWLTVPATRDDNRFLATIPSGNAVFGGPRPPVNPEHFAVFRSFTFHDEWVEHHVPDRTTQRWLFVTIDEIGEATNLR